MDTYELSFGDATVKVNVIDHPSILEEKLSEFKCMLRKRVVGVGFESKCAWVGSVCYPRWLLLCGGSRFLMIDLKKSSCSDSLRKFLTDETICFVGLSQKVADDMMKLEHINCKSFVEVGYLAARVLKKSSIQSYGLENLGAEVGIDVKPKPVSCTQFDDWAEIAMFLSKEQIKCVIHDVYYSFIIGHELLGML
ncbi:hypothetical protein L484_007925 [Morus notabilis]|uniref:3'-5' exonuclease domain-containing protein n=2 Tax=Morus notabilis TaxID=981085 RepID=W9QQH0_9ROSA|nr:hypothetical protein L484_007925 [Morus notabilis]